MASHEVSEEQQKLSEIFDEGWALFLTLIVTDEPTNSLTVQTKVKQCMRLLENATRLTSLGSVFSHNESIEEVATADVKLFLLPALLGTLTLKLTSRERSEIVQTADIYFRDFLQRCKDYSITDIDIPPPFEPEEETEPVGSGPQPAKFNLESAARRRASKIKEYHEQKALEAEIESMRKILDTTDNDEIKRKYYLSLIKSYISKSLEEIDALEAEKRILKHMAKVKREESMSGAEEKKKANIPKPKPLVPIIITRDEVQKKVFGAGYPSLPTMTVQEFYEKKIRDGDFPDPSKIMSLQNVAAIENADEMKEEEAAETEMRIENDDPELLERNRRMDEYKDEHRRGEGNRYNRS